MTVTQDQKTAVTDDGNGGTIELTRMSSALLRGNCEECNMTTYVESRLGAMLCAHCGKVIPAWAWGALEPVFIPEQGTSR